jgi:aspartate aminotransferase-like enzyme
MGLHLFIPAEHRLNSVVAVSLPQGVVARDVLGYMSKKFNVEISGSFGLDVVRIGQMGEQCRSHNLFKALYATGMSFRHFGVNLGTDARARVRVMPGRPGRAPKKDAPLHRP